MKWNICSVSQFQKVDFSTLTCGRCFPRCVTCQAVFQRRRTGIHRNLWLLDVMPNKIFYLYLIFRYKFIFVHRDCEIYTIIPNKIFLFGRCLRHWMKCCNSCHGFAEIRLSL